ncbi:hypothetical protein ACSQ67_024700 [Phaseolus vulgaris]
MAQFTTQGRLKLLFNGEGVSSILEQKDPFLYKCRSVQTNKRRTRCMGSSARIYYASTSSLCNKSNRCNAGASSSAGNGSVHDEYDEDEDEDDGYDEDDDVFDRDGLSCFRGLVLDIAYRPVNVVGWKRAICLEFMEKADVLEYYAKTVNSPSGSFYIPAVLRVPHLLQVVKRRIIKSNLSRKNILFRDNYSCQYCSSRENLTIDHVVPAALGGEWTWENLQVSDKYSILPWNLTLVSKWLTGSQSNIHFSFAFALFTVFPGNLWPTLKFSSPEVIFALNNFVESLFTVLSVHTVDQAPKDYDILAIPLTAAALRMLTLRKGTPEEWRQYLRSP